MTFNCPECRNKNTLAESGQFFSCNNCKVTLKVDLNRIRTARCFAASVKSDQAGYFLNKYFDKKGFGRTVKIVNVDPCYIPFWQEKGKGNLYNGNSASSSFEIGNLNSEKTNFDFQKCEESFIQIYSIETEPDQTRNLDLIYIPFFKVVINFKGENFVYFINAVNGMVFENEIHFYPERKTYKLLPLFLIIFIVFFAINYFFDQLLLSLALNFASFYLLYSFSLNLIIQQKWKT